MPPSTLSSSPQNQTRPRPGPGPGPGSAEAGSRCPFAKLDRQIEEVSDQIWPKQPYLITIPSDFPYRRHSTDPNRWYLNTPFSKREEQLQYMSLLTHQDSDEGLLRVDGSRIDDDGLLTSNAPSPRSELPSRPETPIDNAPKKKISLKDYKQKDRGSVDTPERPQSNDIRKQAIKSHKEEADVRRQQQQQQEQPPKQEAKVKQVHKPAEPKPQASAASKTDAKASPAKATQHDKESLRPAKKRRLSDEEEGKPAAAQNRGSAMKKEATEKRELPALLSPDMPRAEQKPKARGLPVLLSPKLPPTLEKAAAAPVRTDQVRTILKKTLASPTRPAEKKADGTVKDAAVSRPRAEHQNATIPGSPSTKVSSPIVKPATTTSTKQLSTANGQNASPRPRQRHIIVLRYGKKNRKRVEMLLKFAPRQRKDVAPSAEPERTQSSKQPAQTESAKPEPTRPDKKRPAEQAPDVPAKKARLAAQINEAPHKQDRPSTPKGEAVKSPAHSAKPKSAFSTPKKDPNQLKSVAMQRVASTDTADARTPSQDAGRTSTPLTVNHSSQPKTSPAPTLTPKSEEYTAWADLNTRIFQLGRALKKEGSKLASEGEGKTKQQGVVLLIEALLCFMLNSAAQSQARPNIDPGWSTILPYHIMVYKQSRPYKHLHGLVIQLGAVIRQHLQQEHLKRLAKETLPDDPVSAPTPGSDGNTRSGDDSARKQKSFLELRDELTQNTKELKIAWLDSSRQLPYDVIEDQYPTTWKHRSKDFGKRQSGRLNPRDLSKDYYLPLDVSTNVFEATNFALAFLKEWAMFESVQWKARIEL